MNNGVETEMRATTTPHPEPGAACGLCPVCHQPGEHERVMMHWCFCPTHKLKWLPERGNYPETEQQEFLYGCRIVKPFYGPRTLRQRLSWLAFQTRCALAGCFHRLACWADSKRSQHNTPAKGPEDMMGGIEVDF